MAGKPSTIRIHGPLQPFAQGLAADLVEQRYAEGTVMHYLYLLADLSRWLADRHLVPAELFDARVDEFLRSRRAAGKLRRSSRRAVAPLMTHLRQVHAVPDAMPEQPTTKAVQVLEEFASHLAMERGLAPGTIAYYRRIGTLFLSGLDRERLGDISVSDLSAFMVDRSRHLGAGGLGNVVTGLRALLRFLHLVGYIPIPLAPAVFAPPGWQRDSLPKAVEPTQVTSLLASVDRESDYGRRDFAILLLLVRLGLRAREVATLQLDDVNWRAGEILVTGKNRRRDQLPLPVDVGRGLAEYCTRRPRNPDCRSLFLQERAPHAPLSRMAVTALVYRATVKAGLPRFGPHRLRHTAATEMRRAGVSLAEIGQVLRHRDVGTTALYARDDMEALRSIAGPWPGDAE